MRKWVEEGDAPQVVADMVVKAATARKPKLRCPAGRQSRQIRFLRRFMPERLVDIILRQVQRPARLAVAKLRDNPVLQA